MADNVGNVIATLELDTRRASQQFRRFQGEVNRSTRNLNGLGTISKDARQFEAALGAATNRVTAFAAAAGVFTVIERSVSSFVSTIIEVDQALARINVNLGETQQGLKRFSSDLFNISRQTGQTFAVTAKAAEELARQGLGAEETTKRLKDALILSRIAGINSADAVESLTAAINSFSQSALTSTEVVNKFAAVDTKFAVSSKDLAEAIQRVGSTAQSAGVGINELVALVTSLQQTTARGGATIGNGLKTIFTRIQAAPETIAALEGVGVAIKNSNGELRSAIDILRDYTVARQKVGEAERQSLDRTVAGTFQVNILKAAIADLSRENSIYNSALRSSNQATDEAIRKNEQLNQSLSSLLNQTTVSLKEFFNAIGEQSLSPVLQELFRGIENIRKFFTGETGSSIGKSLGEGLLGGITSVLSGPVLIGAIAILGRSLAKVFSTLGEEARALFSINNTVNTRARIQERINYLLKNATDAEYAQYRAATSVLAKKQAILQIQQRIAALEISGDPLTRSFVNKGFLGRSGTNLKAGAFVPNNADPIASAVSREIAAGVPANAIYIDRDSRVASPGNPSGLLIANTRDEPKGGFQGVNRAISQGMDPKKAGLPNFAAPFIRTQLRSSSGQFISQTEVDSLNKLISSLNGLDRIRLNKAAKEIKDFTSALNEEGRRLVNARVASEYSALRRREGRIVTAGDYTVSNASLRKGEKSVMSMNVEAARQGGILTQKGSFSTYRPYGVPLNESPEGFIGPSYTEFRQYRNRMKGERMDRLAAAMERGAQKRRLAMAQAEQKRQTNFSRAQIIGIGASLTSGFIPEGEGGTTQGIIGGLGRGAAYGAGIGGLLGPKGLAAGALIGGLIGAFQKLTKSIEEQVATIDESNAKRAREVQTLELYSATLDKLKEAQESGADEKTLKKIKTELFTLKSSLSPEAAKAFKEGKKDDFGEQQRLAIAKGELEKTIVSKSINTGAIRGAFSEDFLSSLTPDKLRTIGKASFGNFRPNLIQPVVGLAGTGDAGNAARNAEEIRRAQEAYKKSIEELTPVIGDFVDVAKLTPDTLAEFAQGLRKAILQARQIEKEAPQPAVGDGRRRLVTGAFVNAPNQEPFARAGMLTRQPFVRQGTRSQIEFQALQALAAEDKSIEGSSIFKERRAANQLENVQATVRTFLQGAGRDSGIFSERGGFNMSAMRGRLGGMRNSATAQFLLAQLNAAEMTAMDAKALPKQYLNGFEVGADYNKFTRSREKKPGYSDMSALQSLAAAKRQADTTDFITKENIKSRLPEAKPFDLVQEIKQAENLVNKIAETTIKAVVEVNGLVKVVSDRFAQAEFAQAIDASIKKAIEEQVAPLRYELQANGVINARPPTSPFAASISSSPASATPLVSAPSKAYNKTN